MERPVTPADEKAQDDEAEEMMKKLQKQGQDFIEAAAEIAETISAAKRHKSPCTTEPIGFTPRSWRVRDTRAVCNLRSHQEDYKIWNVVNS